MAHGLQAKGWQGVGTGYPSITQHAWGATMKILPTSLDASRPGAVCLRNFASTLRDLAADRSLPGVQVGDSGFSHIVEEGGARAAGTSPGLPAVMDPRAVVLLGEARGLGRQQHRSASCQDLAHSSKCYSEPSYGGGSAPSCPVADGVDGIFPCLCRSLRCETSPSSERSRRVDRLFAVASTSSCPVLSCPVVAVYHRPRPLKHPFPVALTPHRRWYGMTEKTFPPWSAVGWQIGDKIPSRRGLAHAWLRRGASGIRSSPRTSGCGVHRADRRA